MLHKRFSLFISALILFSFALAAQAPSPIKWRMSVKMTAPNEGIVTMKAIIDNGWHLYGTQLPKDGPVPTTFDFSSSKGIKFIDNFTPSAKPQTKKDPSFGLMLDWWTGSVSFSRKFRLTGDIKDAVVSGNVRFMGCDDRNCLPPKTLTFTVKPKAFSQSK